jgi:hypothetical protein
VNRVCVATSKARAYYALVSRLRRAGLPFTSLLPDSDYGDCELVLTTADEAERFGEKAIPLEGLDENPGIFKGQVVAELAGKRGLVLVGIDPGKRTGLAVFYGQTRLAFNTFDAPSAVVSRVAAFAKKVPADKILVRVGDGNRPMATRLVDGIRRDVPTAMVEVVDESGTSTRSSKMKGIQRDQVAAAKIAFRKGEVVSDGTTRSRG